jgi:hypothetical protein
MRCGWDALALKAIDLLLRYAIRFCYAFVLAQVLVPRVEHERLNKMAAIRVFVPTMAA